VNELTVIPSGSPFRPGTVAITMPVAKRPQVFRKRSPPTSAQCILIELDNALSLILS
jgi:hypothetical protein